MKHCIRLATPSNQPAIEAIVEAAYAPYIQRMGMKPGPMLDDYAARIDAGQAHVLEKDGVICGLVVIEEKADHLYLDNIAVRVDFKGQGFGRTLMEFVERSAKAAGFHKIKLLTNETMVENIALYGRIGFVETHRATEFGRNRVFMEKGLG